MFDIFSGETSYETSKKMARNFKYGNFLKKLITLLEQDAAQYYFDIFNIPVRTERINSLLTNVEQRE